MIQNSNLIGVIDSDSQKTYEKAHNMLRVRFGEKVLFKVQVSSGHLRSLRSLGDSKVKSDNG